MKMKRGRTGRAVSMPSGIGAGIGTGIAVMILGGMILAWLVERESIPFENIGYGCMVIQLASSWLGSVIAGRMVKHRLAAVTAGVCAGLFAVLLMMSLLFDGGLEAVWVTAGMLALGGGISRIGTVFGGMGGVRRRKKVAYR